MITTYTYSLTMFIRRVVYRAPYTIIDCIYLDLHCLTIFLQLNGQAYDAIIR